MKCDFMFGSLALLACLCTSCSPAKPPLTVGAKTATDQSVLAEIIAQQVETRTGLTVRRKMNLGGTALTHQALLMTEIDMYPESSGSIVSSILKETPDKDPAIVLERARAEMDRLAHLQFIGPLGIENPFAVAVRAADAKEQKLETISDAVKSHWDFGSTSEFQSRPDGTTALQSTYSLPLKSVPKVFDYSALYKALADGQVNMVAGSLTDGALSTGDFKVLKDDKQAFPPAQVGIVVRQDVFQRFPQLREALTSLSGKLSTDLMRKMDYQVETKHRSAHDVAADFLAGRIQ